MTTKSRLYRWFAWLVILPLFAGCVGRAATFEEAAQAIRKCGMSPNDVLWRVTNKGEVMVGRKRGDATGSSFQQVDCFMRWATDDKIKVGFVGWETNAS